MKTLFRFVTFVLLVAGWGLASLSLHVVRAQGDRIVLIPKQRLSIVDTYVDARTWKIDDATDHPELLERILESGKANSFSYVVNDPSGDVAKQLDDALKSAPTTRPDDIRKTVKSAMTHARKTAKTASSWWDLGN